ncbi:unnamed protein product [Didymodactylos carnosus]|uniref:FAD dependent oxidoreductase domain-containing protein n=1 Tax=Didymodactylos carnosus TaxID=1234261 RepID=A0A814C7F9_9BILA|nr:unnamed protein product [Didymodactylos carnosus]CAF1346915.1 unnamed protein product [Didymodactylos carnosus]CAF3713568.1 unnamed protein product [Didymodactylos carnosus]CAF4157916.1 unnamed protein product [Didymodactylos carnosus]
MTTPRICIVGGGVLGAAVAYHLCEAGCTNIVIVERTGIACGASGRAGGFLAKNWSDSKSVGQLSTASFLLHEKVAEKLRQEYNIDVMYRRVTTLNISLKEKTTTTPQRKSDTLPKWVTGDVFKEEILGTEATTAQVHPGLLTNGLVRVVESKGGRVLIGKANGFLFETITTHTEKDHHHQTAPVQASKLLLENQDPVEADIFILTLGPWTYQAATWFKDSVSFKPNISRQLDCIQGLKAHSIVFKGNQPTEPYAFFLNYVTSANGIIDPEIYPRPNGDIYVCGFGEQTTQNLPDDANHVSINETSCDKLKEIAIHVSSTLKDANVEVRQACYLPISPDGIPLIGKLYGLENVYIATGHSCWGILNSLETGHQLAQLIINGQVSPILNTCDPARFSKGS